MNIIPLAETLKAAPAAMLKIAGLNLLLPQSDVRTVESASDIDTAETEPHSAGWINYAKMRWPVYCLSEDLALLAHIPPARRACVMLAVSGGHIGILSDDVIIMRQVPAHQYEVPVAMKFPDTPIQHLFTLDDAIVCVTDAEHLAEHIARMAIL